THDIIVSCHCHMRFWAMMLDTVFAPEHIQHMQDLCNALLNGPLTKQLGNTKEEAVPQLRVPNVAGKPVALCLPVPVSRS
ncbi:MAG: hypothetical protein ACKPKO_64555, partial [Candidatus Fonsibacter sp.]